MAEAQIALMVVAINIGVLGVVLFAAFCINNSVKRSHLAPGPDIRPGDVTGEPR